MNYTRLDIACAVRILSRFTNILGRKYWKEISRIIRYLKHTLYYGVHNNYSTPV